MNFKALTDVNILINKYYKLLTFIALLCLVVAPFSNVVLSRVFILMAIFLSAAILIFNVRKHIYFALLLTCTTFIYPIFFGPAMLFRWDLVSKDMLLFNYEILYDDLNEKLLFFSNPKNHHAYYPLSYIACKIIYDIVYNAYIVHLLLRPLLHMVLLLCLGILLIRKANYYGADADIATIVVYSVCLLFISYLDIGGSLSFWDFRTVGYTSLIPLLVLVLRFVDVSRTCRKNITVTKMLLLSAIIMSESIYLTTGLMLFSLYLYYLSKNKRVLNFLKYLLLSYLTYQLLINFISYVQYSNYLWLLELQIKALIEGNLYLKVKTAVTTLRTTYPYFDRVFVACSYIMMYGLIPLVIVFRLIRRVKNKIVPLKLITIITIVFIIVPRLMPNIFINNIGGIFYYSYLPLLSTSLTYYLIASIKRKRCVPFVFQQSRVFLLLFFIICFSSINTIFKIYPKSVYDPVIAIDDSRVAFHNTYFMAQFLNSFYFENVCIHYHKSSHIQERYVREEILSKTRCEETDLIITLPKLPTIFENQRKFYETILYEYKNKIEIIYSQERWSIIVLRNHSA